LALALHLFRGYCKRRGVEHPDVDRYVDYLWEFIGFDDPEAFGRWVKKEPPLVAAGLGCEFRTAFKQVLAAAGVSEKEFQQALMSCTEVLYTSMYGACDDEGSKRYLSELADIAVPLGVKWADIRRFAASRWEDEHGWGKPLTPQELAQWRADES
jgi:hypothetical protein